MVKYFNWYILWRIFESKRVPRKLNQLSSKAAVWILEVAHFSVGLHCPSSRLFFFFFFSPSGSSEVFGRNVVCVWERHRRRHREKRHVCKCSPVVITYHSQTCTHDQMAQEDLLSLPHAAALMWRRLASTRSFSFTHSFSMLENIGHISVIILLSIGVKMLTLLASCHCLVACISSWWRFFKKKSLKRLLCWLCSREENIYSDISVYQTDCASSLPRDSFGLRKVGRAAVTVDGTKHVANRTSNFSEILFLDVLNYKTPSKLFSPHSGYVALNYVFRT